MGSYKVAGSSDSRFIYGQMASIQAFFNPTFHKIYLNPCLLAQSPASCVLIPCQLSACPGKMGPSIDHLDTHQCQTS